jgi:dTDP-4-dehydrorhamnose reductase
MPLPSAEMIERAARAIDPAVFEKSFCSCAECVKATESIKNETLRQARAVLTTILPAVLEKAELEVYRALASNPVHAELAATAIRSLIPKENDNG